MGWFSNDTKKKEEEKRLAKQSEPVNKKRPCMHCNGGLQTVALPGGGMTSVVCPVCNGTGWAY